LLRRNLGSAHAPHLLFKTINTGIYETIILPVFCMGRKHGLSYYGKNIVKVV
jgi:hypothetical protein